jgi:hypothetical protein
MRVSPPIDGEVVNCLRNVEQLHETTAKKGFLTPDFLLPFRLCPSRSILLHKISKQQFLGTC